MQQVKIFQNRIHQHRSMMAKQLLQALCLSGDIRGKQKFIFNPLIKADSGILNMFKTFCSLQHYAKPK
jgi:hypothetical protein